MKNNVIQINPCLESCLLQTPIDLRNHLLDITWKKSQEKCSKAEILSYLVLHLVLIFADQEPVYLLNNHEETIKFFEENREFFTNKLLEIFYQDKKDIKIWN